MDTILEQQFAELLNISKRQIFFIGGAPRSGTTWLQQILDAHPEICCRGEGFFGQELVAPLAAVIDHWRSTIDAKNHSQFEHTGGYPPPEPADTEFLLRTALLRAFSQQCRGASYRAVGEKTPENVFAFPMFRKILPEAKFIGIARDPRDVIASTWHFFRKPIAGPDEVAAKFALIHESLPLLKQTHNSFVNIAREYPMDAMIVTYAGLTNDTNRTVEELFEFLEVATNPAIITAAIEQASFVVATGGRQRGDARDGEFLRKGVVGDWRSTLTPAMSDLILQETGWMFEHYGWQP